MHLPCEQNPCCPAVAEFAEAATAGYSWATQRFARSQQLTDCLRDPQVTERLVSTKAAEVSLKER